MNRLLPVAARLRRKLIGNRALSECASEVVELAPALLRRQPAAISMPGEIDRIIAVQEETTPAIERGRISAGERPHGPTMAYRIDNAIVADGSVYFKGGYEILRRHSTGPLLPRDVDRFAEVQLCTDTVIERYFGHWVRDGLLLELLAQQRAMPGLRLMSKPWLHEPGYRDLCGLEAVSTRHARIERLWLVDDRGINDGRIARLEEVRRRVRSAVNPSGARRVMLTRGKLGARRELVNEHEVHCALVRQGFEIVDPEAESPQRIAETLANAELAIFVEGSAQNHCLLAMPVGSTLLTIQPATLFNCICKTFADPIGLHWGYVVADPDHEGFRLPVDRLLRTLDEVARVTAMAHCPPKVRTGM